MIFLFVGRQGEAPTFRERKIEFREQGDVGRKMEGSFENFHPSCRDGWESSGSGMMLAGEASAGGV